MAKKRIIRQIILLFGLLIIAILINAALFAYRETRAIEKQMVKELDNKLDIAFSLQNYEIEKLEIISGIVREQNQKFCDYIDAGNQAAVAAMIKSISVIYGIDMAFIFNENRDLLAAHPQQHSAEATPSYQPMIADIRERVGVEHMDTGVASEQLPRFEFASDQPVLSFKSVIRLLHHSGITYGYVVLTKIINFDAIFAREMAAVCGADIVYYGDKGQILLTTFMGDPAPIPTKEKLLVAGKDYPVRARAFHDYRGREIGSLAVAIDDGPYMGQLRNHLLANLFPFWVSIVISIALFMILKMRVFNKINALIAVLHRVTHAQRDFSVRLTLGSGRRPLQNTRADEVERMCLDFNRMMDKLEETYNGMIAAQSAVEVANRELEERVGERTGQLIETNTELKIEIEDRKRAEKERGKMEKKLRRAQKMEAIGTLAAGVAHDLNNILSGIVSYPELLLLDLPEESTLRGPLVTIQKSGTKASAIVQDLLTLARRGVPVTEVIDLNKVVEEYLTSPEFKKMIHFHPKVRVESDIDTHHLKIIGSPVHLSKTVMNLVSNAAEAMPDGGVVTISIKDRYIDVPIRGYDDVQEGDYVVLSVSDTGVGINPEDQERIFEPFYTKKNMGRSGTGLGMAVVWGTVKDHSGYIDVDSREGSGTTFKLYFPVVRQEFTVEKAVRSLDQYAGRGESVLVVDDAPEQREIAAGMLSKLGYHVESADSGEAALAYLNVNKADILILDMIMEPGLDGLDTYKRAIEIHPGQKAVIASGYAETDRVREVQHLGGGTYVRKPYTLEKIGTAVREELDRG